MSHYFTKEECRAKAAELTARQKADPAFDIALTFRKDAQGWYAEVPTHTRSENAMVAGADKLCERLAQGHDAVEVRFRTVPDPSRTPVCTLKRFIHAHGMGGTYLVQGGEGLPGMVWICDVTHDVMGEHAERVYVYAIKQK